VDEGGRRTQIIAVFGFFSTDSKREAVLKNASEGVGLHLQADSPGFFISLPWLVCATGQKEQNADCHTKERRTSHFFAAT
jgi:hypothetical protein